MLTAPSADQTALYLITLKDWVVPIVSALIGGLLALVGAIWAVRESSKDLEAMEIRQQRVECFCNLTGLRHAITNAPLIDEDRSRLLFELNRISILWSDNPEVLTLAREFFSSRNNHLFIRLLRAMGKGTKLPVENLSDADFSNVFLVSNSRG